MSSGYLQQIEQQQQQQKQHKNESSPSSHLSNGKENGDVAGNEESGKNGGGKQWKKPRAQITVPVLRQMKREGSPIVALTAYDFAMASEVEEAGIDVLLVGDSLACVVQGHANTLPVSMEHMLYHAKIVSRAVRKAFLIVDLPFSCSYSVEKVVESSVRFLSETGAAAVKLELPSGSDLHLQMVRQLTARAIPVCAHIGLTPQSLHALGGYRVQGTGKAQRSANQLLELAIAAETAGAFLLVLECVPEQLARQITETLAIPTIGIGAGVHCDGQILVLHDMLGIGGCGKARSPKFVKNFLQGRDSVQAALCAYAAEVRERQFPADEHTYH